MSEELAQTEENLPMTRITYRTAECQRADGRVQQEAYNAVLPKDGMLQRDHTNPASYAEAR